MAIVIHKIGNNYYSYEHYREGDKIKSDYICPVSSKEKIKIVKVTPKQDAYMGMNYYAARELGIKYPYDKNTVRIDKELTKKERQELIRHEIIEVELMKTGIKYKDVHKIATQKEKLK